MLWRSGSRIWGVKGSLLLFLMNFFETLGHLQESKVRHAMAMTTNYMGLLVNILSELFPY